MGPQSGAVCKGPQGPWGGPRLHGPKEPTNPGFQDSKGLGFRSSLTPRPLGAHLGALCARGRQARGHQGAGLLVSWAPPEAAGPSSPLVFEWGIMGSCFWFQRRPESGFCIELSDFLPSRGSWRQGAPTQTTLVHPSHMYQRRYNLPYEVFYKVFIWVL